MPSMQGARAGASRTTCTLTILGSGEIFTDRGVLTQAELPQWLKTEGKGEKNAVLLLIAGVNVPIGVITRIQSMATGAGFAVHLALQEASAGAAGR